VVYVAQHSNSLLPMQYRVAAVWGGHEGSLLLWMLMLTWWAFGVAHAVSPACPKRWSPACSARWAWSPSASCSSS
jgi:cytochrome c biogenesis factor